VWVVFETFSDENMSEIAYYYENGFEDLVKQTNFVNA
jgi:hypothetical protein